MRWITAHNLQEWSNSLTARTALPGLIADLIIASAPNIAAFRFPNREKGQVRGFDGILDATGVPPFVPDGSSIWEFGVSSDVLDKADNDFEKRTKAVDPAVRANTTFVFVTPRTWDRPSKQITEWLSEKRALAEWKGVECFDGVNLEHWLDKHPAVASHYARYELGLMPTSGAYSSNAFWDEFSTRFSPTLTEDILLAGRKAQSAQLLQRLTEEGSKLAFAADSADEVIAFVVATIRQAPPETRAFLEARAIVVDSVDAARQLIAKKGGIYLPRGQARQLAGQLAQAGPTVISAGADDLLSQHDVLARPTSSELAKAFLSMGITGSDGYELARRCGRSLAVLARQIPSGTAEPAEWLRDSDTLIPALLAGAWQPSVVADAEVLKALGGSATYEDIEAPLRKLTKLKDPPLDRAGDVWTMRSSADAFLHLGHLIGSEHLARFADQANAVFSRVIELPKADDIFKTSPSQGDQHSQWLREGMMTTLLHMAALHEKAGFVVTGSSPQRFVEDVVRGLLNLSTNHRLLESLRDQLPLLAEAAPIPFLESLERLLEGDGEKIKPIFSEQEDVFAPPSAHPAVLRALEVLAWNENYLLRAAISLAKLAAIDPGGKLANRPINSLRDILLSWSPHTNAPYKQRVGVLTHVLRTVPSIAWSLLVKLLPQPQALVSMTQKPKFAEASPGDQETLTYGIIWATQATVVNLAAQHAGLAPERWQKVIAVFSHLQPDSFKDVVKLLEECLDKQEPEARFATWDALRKEVHRRRSFMNLDSTIKDEQLHQLDALVTKYQPDDPLLSTTWLFDDWIPDIGAWRDGGDPMLAIQAERVEALKEVIATHGIRGLSELATRVKVPFKMAESLAQLTLGEQDTLTLMRQLLQLNGEAKGLARLVFAQELPNFGISLIEQVRLIQGELNLSTDEMASLFLALDDSKPIWDTIESFGAEIDEAYWKKKGAFGFRGTIEEMEYAISRYHACGRTLAAIEATNQRLGDVNTATMLSLLGAAIPELNAIANGGRARFENYIERLFENLEKRPDVAREDLARVEFAYMPLFLHRRKQPLTLHRMLVESPEFFVSMICAVFKPASSDAPIPTEQERKLAVAAYKLLNSLVVLPGEINGSIDFATLQAWTDEVRQQASQVDRGAITDTRIGNLLAHSPADPEDQAWPHKAVRNLIEHLSSEDVEKAVRNERFNMRGVHSKAIGEGGQQERILAGQTKAWAYAMPEFPRTANMLSSIAEMWSREGERADADAAKEAFRR